LRPATVVDRYLQGMPQPEMPPVPVRRRRLECIEVPASTKMVLKRPEMSLLNPDRRRITFQQIELGCSENAVREEARRCLRCDICRRCGGCVEICRDRMGVNALQLGYLDFNHPVESDFRVTGERCIACGACAENCPNEALVLRDRDGERSLCLCGTHLNRLELEPCEECGAALGTARYRRFIAERVNQAGLSMLGPRLCADYARRYRAARQSDNLPPAWKDLAGLEIRAPQPFILQC
jgi:ferredoxin